VTNIYKHILTKSDVFDTRHVHYVSRHTVTVVNTTVSNRPTFLNQGITITIWSLLTTEHKPHAEYQGGFRQPKASLQ
jgi:hypothetical protein